MVWVYGFGDVKIDLSLSSTAIKPGQTLEGTVKLTLNHDVQAKGITATFSAIKWVFSNLSVIEKAPQRVPKEVYKEQKVLDVEKTYHKSDSPLQYSFKFVVPEQTKATTSSNSSFISDGFSSLSLDKPFSVKDPVDQAGPVKWYLEVKLDIPHALEVAVSKTQELTIVAV